MNRISIMIFAAMFTTGCVMLSSEEQNLITKARLIHKQPVSRTELIKTLGLDPNSSHCGGGEMRSGQMIFVETWTHPSGVTIKAYDSQYLGPIQVTSEMVDGILDGTATIPGTSTRINAPRKTFNGFTISRDDSELYNSHKDQGEQAAPSNH